MPIPKIPIDILRCPVCSSRLEVNAEAPRSSVRCHTCHKRFPVLGQVIDFLPDVPPHRGLALAAMQSRLIVRIYESHLWRRSPLFAAATRITFDHECDVIISAADLDAADTVLDLACGPGIYSRPIARQLDRGCVIGVDLSMPMLKHAARRATQDEIRNLALVRADAMSLPVATAAVDAALCCGALHLFPEPALALTGLCRVLKPGRPLVLAVFYRRETRLAAFRSRIRKRLYGFTSFSALELQSMLAQAGFDDIKVHHAKGMWLIASARKWT